MVDVNKTNLPKFEMTEETGKKPVSSKKQSTKLIPTSAEPVRKSKLTKTFKNVSRDTIYIGSLGISPGKSRILPNAVADAFIESDYNTKLYIKNNALKIE